MNDCEKIEATIAQYANFIPSQLLSTKQEQDSIPVRRFLFALEGVVSQLKYRISPSVEKYCIACSYKFSGPHRHQLFWRSFRRLKSLVCRYNSFNFLKILNDLHKKLSSSVAQNYYYMPTVETLQYIGATYLQQLFILERLKESCIKAADVMLGYIDIGHWQNLGLFILGLCGEIFQAISTQAASICNAYDTISEFIICVDSNFPSNSLSISVVSDLVRKEETAPTDSQRVLKLLKFSETQMKEAVTENEMTKSRSRAEKELKTYLDATMELGVNISREKEIKTEIYGEYTNINMKDASLLIKRKKKIIKKKMKNLDKSEINTAATSSVTKIKKKLKKIRQLLPQGCSTPIATHKKIISSKKIRRDLDISLSSINSETDSTPVKIKKIRVVKEPAASFTSNTSKIVKRKKKKQKEC